MERPAATKRGGSTAARGVGKRPKPNSGRVTPVPSDNAPATTPSSRGNDEANINAYIESLKADAATLDDDRLSFQNLYQRPMNQRQQAIHDAYLARAEGLYEWLWESGGSFDPGFNVYQDLINRGGKMFSTDKHTAQVYTKEEDDDTFKVGAEGDGSVRLEYYRKKHRKKKLPGSPVLVSNIDIDNLTEPIQRELAKRALAIMKEFRCKEYPRTLAEAYALDNDGLPFAAQTFFYSLTTSGDECKILGDGIKIWGFLRRGILNMLEDGMQVSLLGRSAIDDRYSCHESVHYRALSLFAKDDHDVCVDAEECYAKVFSTDEEKEYASRTSIKPRKVHLAWAPGRTATCPKKYEEAKPIIAKKVFPGIELFDPFIGPPIENPQNSDEMFDADNGYDTDDEEDAWDNTIPGIVCIEKYGGGGAFDENKRLWKTTRSKSLVRYLTHHRETLLGVPWVVVHTYPGITVLVLEWGGDDLVRTIVVFRPWCKMIFSKGKTKISWRQLEDHRKAARSAHWAQNFFALLAGTGTTVVDKSSARLVEDNILFNWYVYLPYVMMHHNCYKSCSLDFKNRLKGSEMNTFHPDFTNMIRVHDLDVIGKNARAMLRRLFVDEDVLEDDDEEVEDGVVRRDYYFVRYIISKATYEASTIDEAAESMVRSLRYDRLNNDEPVEAGVVSSRYSAVMRKTDVIFEPLLKRFSAVYKATTQNRGNTTVHRTAKLTTIEDTDDALTYIVENSTADDPIKFFVQADGLGDLEHPTNGAYDDMLGTPFILPEDGTIIEPEHADGESVVFEKGRFLKGIVFSSVRGRTLKKTNGSGKTKRKKCARFPGYKLGWTRSIFRFSQNEIKYMDVNTRVVEVWFVPK